MEPLPQLLPSCRLTGQVRNSFQRWGQPGQQQGRRIPSLSSVRTRSMCCLLVSGLLTEMTQQIHSLRASGVISSHFARATGSEMRTFRKSAGTACTAPRETALLVMDFSLYPIGVVLVRVVGNSSITGIGEELPVIRPGIRLMESYSRLQLSSLGLGPNRTDQLDSPDGTPSAKRAFGLDEGGALPSRIQTFVSGGSLPKS